MEGMASEWNFPPGLPTVPGFHVGRLSPAQKFTAKLSGIHPWFHLFWRGYAWHAEALTIDSCGRIDCSFRNCLFGCWTRLSRCATERCLLLSWADMKGAYKVGVLSSGRSYRTDVHDGWAKTNIQSVVLCCVRFFHLRQNFVFHTVNHRMESAWKPPLPGTSPLVNQHNQSAVPVLHCSPV